MPGALHFVTGNVLDRRPIFRQEVNCRAFLSELQTLRFDRACKIIAFVLMFDHFHLIANPRDGDIQTVMNVLKSFSAKSIIKAAADGTFHRRGENKVWQESFKALPLWSGWMIRQKINYIHANPVKADLCLTAEDYPWTSFRSFYREENDPLLAIDSSWFWEGDEEKLGQSLKEWEAERMGQMIEKIEENRGRLLP